MQTPTLTASEVAAACGVDPYRSPVQLWLEKTGRVEHEGAGEAAHWESLLEPVIAAQLDFPTITDKQRFTDPDRDWLSGEPDGFCRPPTYSNGASWPDVLEIKTAGFRAGRAWQEGDVPAHYVAQVQTYMHLTDRSEAVVVCLVGGQKLHTVYMARDDELIGLLLVGADIFHERVQSDTPPAPDGSKATEDVLKRLYPIATQGVVSLTVEDAATVEKLQGLKRARKAIDTQIAEAEQVLQFRLGEAAVGMYEGRALVRWPTIKARRFSQAALKEAHPEIVEEFTVPSSYRRFTIHDGD